MLKADPSGQRKERNLKHLLKFGDEGVRKWFMIHLGRGLLLISKGSCVYATMKEMVSSYLWCEVKLKPILETSRSSNQIRSIFIAVASFLLHTNADYKLQTNIMQRRTLSPSPKRACQTTPTCPTHLYNQTVTSNDSIQAHIPETPSPCRVVPESTPWDY